MGIFKNLFGGEKPKEKSEIDSSKFKAIDKTDYTSLEELIEQHAGLSFEKQLVFGDVIGSNAWELDMGKGNIIFGDLDFPIQIIGSLSFNDSSWMWGWANAKSGMPENLLVQSNQLKEIGHEKGIKELTDGHFNVEEGFEHKIGMMACGLFNSKSYYCANYGQGTLVVTIEDDKIPEIDKSRIEKVLTNFPQLISAVDLNHKNTFKNYLIDRDFELNISDHKIEGIKNGKVLTAEFDELNRLKSLNGKL
ncbi:hypothetical protein QSV08_07910 [Maribacter sp. BPC-D8]|uniref:DUF6882 domain-containing protein n=1 Tax=Maribacter sp. BPC-D8 TaxID=3053613 RepID=UPI002B4A20B1|nr:DUF6882 domain-containing protein [Maribacter sp. BPC-D8]WRI31169.1 hypothetical protein QSV08_07910 [Maribacter sp. BPC-D8]